MDITISPSQDIMIYDLPTGHFWDHGGWKSGLSIVFWDCGRWKSGPCLLGCMFVPPGKAPCFIGKNLLALYLANPNIQRQSHKPWLNWTELYYMYIIRDMDILAKSHLHFHPQHFLLISPTHRQYLTTLGRICNILELTGGKNNYLVLKTNPFLVELAV